MRRVIRLVIISQEIIQHFNFCGQKVKVQGHSRITYTLEKALWGHRVLKVSRQVIEFVMHIADLIFASVFNDMPGLEDAKNDTRSNSIVLSTRRVPASSYAALSPIHTADATRLDSFVSSASAVCIGLYIYTPCSFLLRSDK